MPVFIPSDGYRNSRQGQNRTWESLSSTYPEALWVNPFFYIYQEMYDKQLLRTLPWVHQLLKNDVPGIRLVSSSGPHVAWRKQGRVEVYHDNQWGKVCSDGWGRNNVVVVCRQLGFSGGTTLKRFGGRSDKEWMTNVQCRWEKIVCFLRTDHNNSMEWLLVIVD